MVGNKHCRGMVVLKFRMSVLRIKMGNSDKLRIISTLLH